MITSKEYMKMYRTSLDAVTKEIRDYLGALGLQPRVTEVRDGAVLDGAARSLLLATLRGAATIPVLVSPAEVCAVVRDAMAEIEEDGTCRLTPFTEMVEWECRVRDTVREILWTGTGEGLWNHLRTRVCDGLFEYEEDREDAVADFVDRRNGSNLGKVASEYAARTIPGAVPESISDTVA